MKKLSSAMAFAMVLTMMLAFSPASHASNNETSKRDEGTEQENYIVSCSNGGKHYMEGRGFAYVHYGEYPGTRIVLNPGCAFQCRYCHLVLVTEHDPSTPYNRSGWGTYAVLSQNEEIAKVKTEFYTETFRHNNSVAEDPYAQGFEFHY